MGWAVFSDDDDDNGFRAAQLAWVRVRHMVMNGIWVGMSCPGSVVSSQGDNNGWAASRPGMSRSGQ